VKHLIKRKRKNNMRGAKGLFITIEGIEGVGKSTAVQFIQGELEARRIPLRITREPGGTPFAESIRNIVLNYQPTERLTEEAESLLMFAARSQHVQNFIRPELEEGNWVLSDRFVDASLAYQGGGRGVPMERLKQLQEWVVGPLTPQLTFLLDAPAEVAMSRVKRRALDRIEQEEYSFFELVRNAYLDLAKESPERFRIIDATASIPDVQAAIKVELDLLVEHSHVS
jgi:dTMP kinase